MKNTLFLSATLFMLAISCKKNDVIQPPTEEPPVDVHTILLKDIAIQNLPSPFYHFDYNDSGYITSINYQDGLALYDLFYENGRIDRITDNTVANKDKLQYFYENGKVSKINFTSREGILYKQVILNYNNTSQLTKAEWNFVNEDASITPEKTIDLSYYADGNLSKVEHHTIEIPGRQTEAFYADSYEQYDNKINVDAFGIIHKLNDHLFLLPNIVIQKNNPLKEIRSGDGLNYSIDYTYTYNDSIPVKKNGDLLILNGENAGTHSNYNVSYSYY